MNYTFLILAIVLLFVLYLLYVFLYRKGSSTITSKIYLKTNSIAPPSLSTFMGTNRYSYCVWIFAGSLGSPSNKIFAISNPAFALDISTNGALTYQFSTETPTVIVSNYPLQKWSYIIVSVDNSVVDTYLDGKLVQSSQRATIPTAMSSKSTLSFGNGDIYISNLQILPTPMDPQTAWTMYMAGNGSSSFSSFGASVELTKDTAKMYNFTLF